LTRVAFEIQGVRRVAIHCAPRNGSSAAVPRKLGFTLGATHRARALTPGGWPRATMVWSLLREEDEAKPVAQVPLAAYDVLGRRLL
jgi:RimJ/RimL family protein N-acetyltransferase